MSQKMLDNDAGPMLDSLWQGGISHWIHGIVAMSYGFGFDQSVS